MMNPESLPIKTTNSDEEISIIDVISLIIKRRKLFLGTIFAAVILSATIIIVLPNKYTATTTILPIEKNSSPSLSSMLSSVGGGLGLLASQTGLGNGDVGDKYIAILNSYTIFDAVIKNNSLNPSLNSLSWNEKLNEWNKNEPTSGNKKHKKQLTAQMAVKKLRKIVSIDKEKKSGLIRISVSTRNPSLSADIANAFAKELETYLSSNTLSGAKQNRKFIEEQLSKVKQDLSEQELKFKNFQQENQIIALDTQAEASIKTYSELRARLIAQEVEMSVLNRKQLTDDPMITLKQEEIDALKRQLNKFEGSQNKDSVFSFSKAPNLSLNYARLKRELLVREKVFELLTQQYEMAKIQESENDESFQILDPALAPENKSAPKRGTLAIIAVIASIVVATILVFIVEFWEKNKVRLRIPSSDLSVGG